MDIPLQNRLKKKAQEKIALLQDELVDILYYASPNAVLHGGTCVWRCYGGNRFSEDIDFYLSESDFDEEKLKERMLERGFAIEKFKKTKNTLFSKISSEEALVRLEISFGRKKEAVARAYEKADGAFMDVLALSAEELLREKLLAYKNRRLIRDIYDVYHLSRIANMQEGAAEDMRNFLRAPASPVDEKNLRTLVYEGAVPSYSQMIDALRGRFL